MNKLAFFEIPKEHLKIEIAKQSHAILEEIKKSAEETKTLPDVSKYYTDLYFPPAPRDRPYTFSSIVLSSDGKMAYGDNPSGPLVAKNNFLDPDGSLGDFWVLNVLRAMADGIIVGARTLLSEPGITCHVYEENLSRQRKEILGKPFQPCGVVVSLDGTDIPFDHYTFHVDPKEKYKMVIATSLDGGDYIKAHSDLKHRFFGPFHAKEEVDKADFGELYEEFDTVPVILTGEGQSPDTDILLYALRKWGMKKLCIEAPSYCTHLLHKELLDEYFINYSMVFVGGKTTPGQGSPFGYMDHPHADLLSLGTHKSNFIFTRQKVRYGVKNETDLTGYKY